MQLRNKQLVAPRVQKTKLANTNATDEETFNFDEVEATDKDEEPRVLTATGATKRKR